MQASPKGVLLLQGEEEKKREAYLLYVEYFFAADNKEDGVGGWILLGVDEIARDENS